MNNSRLDIVINPEFESFRSFVSELTDRFEKEGETIYEGRNMLKVYHINGLDIVVKSFKKPHIINKIAYSFFRESKAQRSYLYALDLLKRGVDTPVPIAYINEYKNALLSRSYYISIYRKEAKVVAPYMCGETEDKQMLRDMVRFIAELHRSDVLHLDLSPGNILLEKHEGINKFTIIDINRLKICKIDQKTAFMNFARLARNQKVSTELAEMYAECRGWDTQECVEQINKYSDDFFRFKTYSFARKEMKRYYGSFKAFCGPVQMYRLVHGLRKLSLSGPVREKLYQLESGLYLKYIQPSDVRGVLLRENNYTKR